MNLQDIKDKIRLFNDLQSNSNSKIKLQAIILNKDELQEIYRTEGVAEIRFYTVDIPRAELFVIGQEDPIHTHTLQTHIPFGNPTIPRGHVEFLLELE